MSDTSTKAEDIVLRQLSSKRREYEYPPGQPPHEVGSNEVYNDGLHLSSDTATNSSDEFNWDEEEVEQPDMQKATARRGRALYLLFMKLARSIRTLLIGVLGSGILITPLIVVQFRAKSSPVRPQVYVWSLWLSIVWAAGCITYLVVDQIPHLVVAIIVLFGGRVERRKAQLELCVAVNGWLKLVLDVAWAWIALSIIRAIYNPVGTYWTVVNRIMQALLASSLIFLAEKLFLHFVAINFHKKALADRLNENRLGLRALDRISNAQPTPQKSPYGKKGHKTPPMEPGSSRASVDLSPMAVRGPDSEKRHRHHKFRSDERKRKKKDTARVIVDSVGGVIGQVALKNSKFNRERDIGSLYSARMLARKLFSALSDVSPPRSHLIVEDFYPYFQSTAEAHEAFGLFDKDKNGDITKKEMREAVQRIYRERKALMASLKDVGSAVAKLDAVLLAVAFVGVIFACLLIFNRENTLASLVPLATIILGFSFIFGHSAQTLFESLIFIFSTHVFDVGDLVMIDDQPLLVREFGLFSTTFRRMDGQEIIAPNALLASTKLVHNLRRSSCMWETTNIMVSYDTPMEVIEQLRLRINSYVAQNNREWRDGALHIDKMEYQNAIHLVVAMEHRPNWQDWGGRWARRTAFMRNLKTILEELDVRYTMPVQPVLLPKAPPYERYSPRVGPPPSPASALGRKGIRGNAGMFQGGDVRAPSKGLGTTG